jgi:hypothetical protein
MKIVDIPFLVRAITDVYGPLVEAADDLHQTHVPTAAELLAGMVRGTLEVHAHDLLRWDREQAQAVEVATVAEAEFAICKACGTIEREYFWCWTIRQLFVTLTSADEAKPEAWQGWQDMAEAINRARAAYPGPVASAVIRALNDPSSSVEFRTGLLDAVITCTPAVTARPAADRGSR